MLCKATECIMNFINSFDAGDIIAFSALILSVVNFVYLLLCDRPRVNVVVRDIRKLYKGYRLLIVITNKSRVNLAIEDIHILQDGHSHLADHRAVKVFEFSYGSERVECNEYTQELPINISGMVSFKGKIDFVESSFPLCPGNAEIILHTNRKVLRRKFTIGDDGSLNQ